MTKDYETLLAAAPSNETKSDKRKEYRRQYYLKNQEKIKLRMKLWREANRDRYLSKLKEIYARNREDRIRKSSEWNRQNPEKAAERVKRFHERHPERKLVYFRKLYARDKDKLMMKTSAWQKKMYKESTNFRLRSLLRTRLQKAIKRDSKRSSALTLLGCSVEEFKLNLENQFLPGMSWDNWGTKGWHIDHIRPCASFDPTDLEQQKQCFHYTNLQPLWAEENLRKHSKYEGLR